MRQAKEAEMQRSERLGRFLKGKLQLVKNFVHH